MWPPHWLNDTLPENTFSSSMTLHAVMLAIGVLAIIGSSLSLVAMVKCKQLHRKDFLAIFVSCINDLCMGFWFTLLSVHFMLYKLMLAYGYGPLCCRKFAFLFNSESLAEYLALMMAIDRSVAIFWPRFYAQVSPVNLHMPLLMMSVVVTGAQTFVLAAHNVGTRSSPSRLCDENFCAGSPRITYLLQGINLCCAVVIILFGVLIIVAMHRKRKQYRDRNLTQLGRFKFDQQKKEIIGQISIISVTVVCQVSGRLCLLLATLVTAVNTYSLLIVAFRFLVCLNAMLNFFVYMLVSPELRTAVKSLFTKSITVNPF